jgi:hypothetical protein
VLLILHAKTTHTHTQTQRHEHRCTCIFNHCQYIILISTYIASKIQCSSTCYIFTRKVKRTCERLTSPMTHSPNRANFPVYDTATTIYLASVLSWVRHVYFILCCFQSKFGRQLSCSVRAVKSKLRTKWGEHTVCFVINFS